MCDAFRRAVGAMGGAERVVHVNLGERGQLLRKLRHILLFFRVKAQVLEQQHFAVFESLGRGFRFRPNAIGHKSDGLAQYLRQARGRRLQAHFGIHFALGTPQVRRQNQTAAAFQNVLNRGQRRLDAGIVGDFSGLVEGHIEIDAHEDAFAFYIEVTNRKFWHGYDLRMNVIQRAQRTRKAESRRRQLAYEGRKRSGLSSILPIILPSSSYLTTNLLWVSFDR